ncbi:uncharacterized protein LOC106644208 [Copidosoma floridanum]|uniref:uncharacterized protein LOC106644208 n=1 Tax=Copidosoma floridanum TaxID=29053 RepID=UPI0006C9CC99|nr:uncharacterized protein LOC106644208 [Copidosoma floridanum]
MQSLCCSAAITDEDLSEKIAYLSDSCTGRLNDTQLFKSTNHRELRLLGEIVRRSTDAQLATHDPHTLVSCAIKLRLKYFSSSLHFEADLSERSRENKHRLAESYLEHILRVLLMASRSPGSVAKTVVDTLEGENFWGARLFCVGVVCQLLSLEPTEAAILCHELCDKIEFPNKSIDTKLIVRVLYELLDVHPWPDTSETTAFLERILNLYDRSLHDGEPKNEADALFPKLRGSLELCIRHVVKNVSRAHLILVIQRMTGWSVRAGVNENVIANYGSALEYVASMYRGYYSVADTLTSEMIALLMGMIASSERCVSLLGNRVLQYMIDSGENRVLFGTPKIFFEGMNVNLAIKGFRREDGKFLKLHRELTHESLTKSLINHRQDRLNLETTYCTLCLLAAEIPCGFTAAVMSCLMMNVQDIVMKNPELIGKEASYHIHAIIISVLSFVCWIHEAKDFHAYVYKIVMERAQWAPHLNPPLRSSYNNFAVHHVLWDKPELFFVDWEVRYGLWRRFRLNGADKAQVELVTNKNDKGEYTA